jgi:hypothetical protein
MGATKRQQILSSIANTLCQVSAIQTVSINKSDPVDLDTIPMPACFVYSGPQNRAGDDDTIMGYETFEWTVIVEVFAENVDMETLLGQIHNKMFFNCHQSGTAEFSWLSGVNIFLIDPLRQLQMMSLEFYVLYRHPMGVPDG